MVRPPLATGGSELVVQEILKHVDEADVYALIDFESANPESYLFGRQIGTTFLQHFPKGPQPGAAKIFAISADRDQQVNVRIRQHPLILPHRRQRHPQQSPATARLLLPHAHALRLGLNF